MKKLIYIALAITVSSLYAQEPLNAIVEYTRVINNPTGVSFGTPYRLYCNTGSSFYERVGIAQRVIEKTEEKLGPNGEMTEDRIMKSSLPYDYYYTDIESNTLVFREAIVGKLFVVQDVIEPINWSLHAENKMIDKYNCQKATATYRGREYTVWFTSEIPISHGPWKLRGLPGLILEMTEETGKYEFHVSKINLKPDNKDIKDKLKIPNTKEIVKMDVYVKALKNIAKDEKALMLASMPRGAKLLEGCDECPDPNNRSLERFE
ncbi:GLPGLI family protein [Aquimarina aggregata]|uniref:GLPGLI family protein n=1 Tax=Aquimarina aggregata TaxID=1642818 RepID=UPI002492CF25|nr:GLPGLI family protein [Aquimarina aggregata]